MAKETRLSDSADIYQPRDNRSDKQKLKDMTFNEKLGYINDYYKYKIITVIVAVILVSSLAYTILTPKPEAVFSAAIINDYLDKQPKNNLTTDFGKYLGISEKQKVLFDDSYLISEANSVINAASATTQKLASYVQAAQIDVIIADEDDFKQLANLGYFLNIEDILPADLKSTFKDKLYFATTEDDRTEKAYGIKITDSKKYQALGSVIKNPVVGVVANTKYKDNTILFLKYLYNMDIK